VLERHLAGRQFLLGDAFSAADVIVGSMVGWARALKLVADFPALHAYSKRLSERPAWARSRSG
jgi:glutathione S-transferase